MGLLQSLQIQMGLLQSLQHQRLHPYHRMLQTLRHHNPQVHLAPDALSPYALVAVLAVVRIHDRSFYSRFAHTPNQLHALV